MSYNDLPLHGKWYGYCKLSTIWTWKQERNIKGQGKDVRNYSWKLIQLYIYYVLWSTKHLSNLILFKNSTVYILLKNADALWQMTLYYFDLCIRWVMMLEIHYIWLKIMPFL